MEMTRERNVEACGDDKKSENQGAGVFHVGWGRKEESK